VGRVIVRPAAPADADELARVQIASWRAVYTGLMNPVVLAGLDFDELAHRWRVRLENAHNPARNLVAAAQGELRGFAAIGAARDADLERGRFGELWAIYVEPAAWGAGVGQALLATAEAELGWRFSQFVLWVLEKNTRARRFYEKHGWVLDGGRKEPVEAGWTLPHLRYRKTK
jgi:GNAT superfamily N-acetyltransferase